MASLADGSLLLRARGHAARTTGLANWRSYLIYRDPKLDRYQSGPMEFGITRFQNGIRLPKPMKQVGNINAKAMPKHEQYNPESE
jgi:hypothetical protein